MDDEQPRKLDIEAMLAALAPPTIPEETFRKENDHLHRIQSWKKSYACSILAGLCTYPAFHANTIRLDWLQRLVLAKAEGNRKPHSAELSDALNAGLDRAKVSRLEDPIEDIFCELVATSRGIYRIFQGLWEHAALYTQTLLDAFEELPDHPIHREALASAYSLLRLSDEIAERSGVDRFTFSGGTPNDAIRIPPTEVLKRESHRIRFRDSDLASMGISKTALSPFILQPEYLRHISSQPVGETSLEFCPLVSEANGILVASPTTISLAVRSIVVEAAKRTRMADALLSSLMIKQEMHSACSGFWPVPSLGLPPPRRDSMRTSIFEHAPGRFVQILQVPFGFEHFPEHGFGIVRAAGEEVNQAIATEVSRFWQILREKSDHRQSTTVLLSGGWGTPHSIEPSIDETAAPQGWHYIPLSFADAAVLGACKNGKF